MTRIVICGGPRTGKTTMSNLLGECQSIRHTDDLIRETEHMAGGSWSECSRLASEWLDETGPWIIEGVAMSRALRKWRQANPHLAPPVDRIVRLTVPRLSLTKAQIAMLKGEAKVWEDIAGWCGHLVR